MRRTVITASEKRERYFKIVGVVLTAVMASEIVQVFVLQAQTLPNLLTEGGASLILVGWWRFLFSPPEERKDLHVLWGWAKYGLILLAFGFVIGIAMAL
jgi:hypothetical protein